jgi:ABC-2 type transport system ATP-binding protein
MKWINKLVETSQYYQNGDLNLGFRRLVDCALDTKNYEILKDVLEFTDWRYNAEVKTEGEEAAKAVILIEKMQKINLHFDEILPKNIITARQVSKKYAKGNFVLGPLDVSVHISEMVGLVGENGNGKTTLLRLLCGELKPTSGEIEYLFSRPYKNIYELKTRLAYVPQRIERLRGSLMDNLQFTLSQYGVKKEENHLSALTFLARLGLWQYKDLDWSRLSSGYKMRFELVRTLLRNPEVLLLDEPLANLDILAQQIILEDLRFLSSSLSRPFGVILSSQQLYEVEKNSDKILFLDKGKLIEQQLVENTNTEDYSLILEFHTEVSREHLQATLNKLQLEKLQYNGGNYIAYFPKGKSITDVMLLLGKEKIPVTYMRDISKSSRRFFIE